MNPMYPPQSLDSVFHSMITLTLGLGMLILLALCIRKIIPPKVVRKLWEGLDLHAARTGYTRGLHDADVHVEHQDALNKLGNVITEFTTQLDTLRAQLADKASPLQAKPEAPRRTPRTPAMPRRSPRPIVPDLYAIPFVSTRKLGLASVAPRS
ncbi:MULTISPECIES: hypothetical protein [unclassified Crossiella]|uniref:hypothetical protein n=1 Tax=unclassified Crossiella TaxID=2620835 RepID=UPI001FFF40C2|nr:MULTISPECIES: hypothetical protein [unclassified Crossiella]MCK2240920.1 hypothetical protein [Crossiella sp. S99.2]MCK2253936.1 hypothetical protein [Crossiella sp. S99.1]